MNALKPIHTVSADCQLVCGRFSPDGSTFVAGGIDAALHRWQVAEKKLEPLASLTGHHGWLCAIAFHPKESLVFTGDSWGRLRCQNFAGDAAPPVWELEAAHDGWLRQVAIASDGKQLATCGRDQMLKLWTPEGKPVAVLKHDDDIFALTYTPDGQQIVFGDQHGHLHVYEVATKKVVRKLDATVLFKTDRLQDMGGLRTLAFSADGKLLFASGTMPEKGATIQSLPTLLSFDFATGKLKQKYNFGALKDGFVEDIAVHPNGFVLGVTSGDPGNGKLLRFRLAEKDVLDDGTALANCQAIALHPDNQRFVVISTNPGSNGNGKTLAKDGTYAANTSPVNLFALPDEPKAAADKASSLESVIDLKVPK